MINKIFRFSFAFYIYLLFLKIEIYHGKVITIQNDSENFKNLKNIVNDNQNDKNGLIIKFEDMEYDMTKIGYGFDITVYNDITFIGNNEGIVFDYKNQKKGLFDFTFTNGNFTLKIENIIFKNAGNMEDNVSTIFVKLLDDRNSKNSRIIINNCTFQNNNIPILDLHSNFNQNEIFKTIFLFNHCNFL